MKIGTNMIFLGILSMLIGTAFASPLLISELEIRPYNAPLPKGPTADIDVNVVYANFSVGDTAGGFMGTTDISYFVVLNITNNSDDWAVVNMAQFSVAQNITKGISSDSPFFGENWTSIKGWEAEGAWVDGEWYNLTWVPHELFWMNGSAMIKGTEIGEGVTLGEGYWMEGVQLMDKAVGGNVTNIYLNMNGTWVDVTGRITWLDNDGNIVDINPGRLPSHTSQAVTSSGTFFGERKLFSAEGSSTASEKIPFVIISTGVPANFDNLWAPHQSRLIVLSADRKIFNMFLDDAKLELLETEPITFRGVVHSYLNGTVGVYDSNSVDDEVKQVQLELTEDGYLYNVILADDEMFVMDSFGVEAFIEPRN
jgi:hypothetical protein